ncbi:SRPBCC domain-containing protein [Nocardioides agariphilus]|jgi:uncharacterized protein YndB with AHSA1/START domain|uniref:SRPBCC domain-containing protein n=1 Tax=Nocardioides agariphilus TaxID=433664 RepID=A0A930YIA2_9ACTN|nr:SRPBCC domain-containing protein [Nocardioides agariphilus]MBF4769496.1 SRPBCC domain-containing protein [Nocardioides agariphilus]
MATVTLTRHVPVPVPRAWRAWSNPAELARWWWPMLPDTTYDWSPEPGAAYAIHSRAAGFGVRGHFTEVDEPRRLVFDWAWVSGDEVEPVPGTVEVTFEARGAGTLVTVQHTSPHDRSEMAGLVEGWHAVLDRLTGVTELV